MDKTKRKRPAGHQWAGILLYLLLGAASGLLIVQFMDHFSGRDIPAWLALLVFGLLLLSVYVAMLVQIVIHEAGHLVFGLLTGYTFSSFRIFSWMWTKEDGQLRCRRLSLAGTGGQCLMSPPDLADGKMPVLLYNFGGAILNLAAGAVCFGLSFLFPAASFLRIFLKLLALIGVAFAFINGTPLRLGPVDNDGRNALSLMRSREAVRAFWIQLKVNELSSRGVRMKDMPEEWFAVPGDAAMRNSITAALGVLASGRLMDGRRFEQAEALMDHLLSVESGINDLYRCLMTCDRLYIECVGQCRPEKLDALLTKPQRKLMKAMRKYPSVLRTEYALALLSYRDDAGARKLEAAFGRCADSYPYPGEIAAERELLEAARAALYGGENV